MLRGFYRLGNQGGFSENNSITEWGFGFYPDFPGGAMKVYYDYQTIYRSVHDGIEGAFPTINSNDEIVVTNHGTLL